MDTCLLMVILAMIFFFLDRLTNRNQFHMDNTSAEGTSTFIVEMETQIKYLRQLSFLIMKKKKKKRSLMKRNKTFKI